jgi:hypothetical protein
MTGITITNDKVVTFYKQNPHLSIDAVNLLIVDLFEQMSTTTIHTESTLLDQVHHTLNTLNNVTKTLQTNLESRILTIAGNGNDDNNMAIGELIEANNSLLIRQMVDTINQVVPDNKTCYSEISKTLDTFYKSITSDTQKLVDTNGFTSIKEYMNNFEMKTTIMLQNLQQPIYSFISASEDRINKNIHAIRSNETEIYSKLVSDVSSLICTNQPHKMVNTNSDKYLVGLLTKTFNSADISMKQLGMSTNTLALKRMRHPPVFIQNYDIEYNVSSDETTQFMSIISDENVCGVFLSQQSGISGKTDFQIELHNNNVIVFVHNAEYSASKMEVAISIIDNIYNQLRQFVKYGTNDDFTIPKDLLESINNEYQLFITQKTAVIDVFKESQKKVLAQIDEIRFPCLDRYLSTKYSAPIVKPGLKCDLCKSYNANNLKALAAHKRGCVRKNTTSTKLTVNPINNSESSRNLLCVTPSFDNTK